MSGRWLLYITRFWIGLYIISRISFFCTPKGIHVNIISCYSVSTTNGHGQRPPTFLWLRDLLCILLGYAKTSKTQIFTYDTYSFHRDFQYNEYRLVSNNPFWYVDVLKRNIIILWVGSVKIVSVAEPLTDLYSPHITLYYNNIITTIIPPLLDLHTRKIIVPLTHRIYLLSSLAPYSLTYVIIDLFWFHRRNYIFFKVPI